MSVVQIITDAATEAVGTETEVLGILADHKEAGTQWVRVMVTGNPSKVAAKELSVATDAIKGALEAKNILAV